MMLRLLTVLAVVVAGCGAALGKTLRLETRYECVWWSTEQMRGLNPNDPPPKATRMRLDKWEYSDPVGVPHPDTVFLMVDVPKGVSGRLVVRTSWIRRKRLQTRVAFDRSAVGGTASGVSIEVPIEVQAAIDRLRPRLLQSRVYLDGREVARRDLPIVLGD